MMDVTPGDEPTRSPLTPEQITRFAQRLRRDRDALNERILAQQERSQDELDPTQARDDRPEHADLSDSNMRLGTLFTEQQHEIDDALLRIELGQYGLCEECGRPIELERLEVQPAARYCREHAHLHDRGRPPKL